MKHEFLNLLSNNRGQGMIETMIVTILFLIAIIFTIIQLNSLVMNELICNEAAFSISRIAVVSTNDKVEVTTKIGALALLGPQFSTYNLIPLRAITSNDTDTEGPTGSPELYQTDLHYATRIMFASILQPLFTARFYSGGNPYYTNVARSRLVKSPNEGNYTKAYPKGNKFDLTAQDYLVLAGVLK